MIDGPVFFLQVCGERQELIGCVRRLRQCYPKSRLLIRFDGDAQNKSELTELYSDPETEIYDEPRLQSVGSGGLSTQRMLEIFLAGSGDVLIKIDADSRIMRSFAELPPGESVYWGGTLQHQSGVFSVQGGCIVMSRGFCRLVADSRLLLGPELLPPAIAWAECSPVCLWRARVAGLSSHDWTLGYAAKMLKIYPTEHPEVVSRWRCLRFTDISRLPGAAVVHPVRHDGWLQLGPFSPFNLKRMLKEAIEPLGLVQLPTGAKRISDWALNTSDFGPEDLPPKIMGWICSNVSSSQSRIALLGCSRKTVRELARFFQVLEVEAPQLLEQQMDVVIIQKLDSAAPHLLASLQHSAVLIIDQIQRQQEFRLFWKAFRSGRRLEVCRSQSRITAILTGRSIGWVNRLRSMMVLMVLLVNGELRRTFGLIRRPRR
jgi:hypothetical protein